MSIPPNDEVPVPPASVPLATNTNKEGHCEAWATLLIELVFVAVPLGVIFVVLAQHGKVSRMLESTEFAFAGIVLGGQAITKFLSGALSKSHAVQNSTWHITMLIAVVAAFLVFLAGTVLYRIVQIKETMEPPGALSGGLIFWQLFIFIAGVFMFIVLGGAGEVARIRYAKRSTANKA